MASILDNDNDAFKRNLIVTGVTPTDFQADDGTRYDYTNLLCLEKLKGDNSHGHGIATYQYGTSHSVMEFTTVNPPFMVQATCTNITDRRGRNQTVITELDLTTIKELELNPRIKPQLKQP